MIFALDGISIKSPPWLKSLSFFSMYSPKSLQFQVIHALSNLSGPSFIPWFPATDWITCISLQNIALVLLGLDIAILWSITSDKMWSTGEGSGKPLQYSCLEYPMNSMKRQKGMTLKDELPRSVGAQCATGQEWRNSSRKNERRAKVKTTPSCGCHCWWK